MDMWQHQKDGVERLLECPAVYLAWEMGTGKTRATIEAILRDHSINRALVIAPKQVVPCWQEQVERFAGEQLIANGLNAGSIKKRTAQAADAIRRMDYGQRGLLVINYESAWREPMASMLKSRSPWPMVVCDEAHRIKAPGGKASWFMKAMGPLSQRRVMLSGTPMPHSPLDLYAQFRFLDKQVFGTSFAGFRSRYAVMGGYGGHQILRFQNLQDLHARFYSRAHRVTKKQVLDLPEVLSEKHHVALGAEARRAYKEMEADFVADVKGGRVTASNALVRLLRLSQIANGFVTESETLNRRTHALGVEKQGAVTDILDDLPSSEAVVVFCRFHNDLDAIKKACGNAKPSRRCFELSGRRSEVNDFLESEAGDVIAIQIGAGGQGVDGLQHRSSYGVFFSVGWSLGEYNQAISRLHRAGQTKPVTFIHLVADGTVDLKVYRAFEKREAVIDTVLDQAKAS